MSYQTTIIVRSISSFVAISTHLLATILFVCSSMKLYHQKHQGKKFIFSDSKVTKLQNHTLLAMVCFSLSVMWTMPFYLTSLFAIEIFENNPNVEEICRVHSSFYSIAYTLSYYFAIMFLYVRSSAVDTMFTKSRLFILVRRSVFIAAQAIPTGIAILLGFLWRNQVLLIEGHRICVADPSVVCSMVFLAGASFLSLSCLYLFVGPILAHIRSDSNSSSASPRVESVEMQNHHEQKTKERLNSVVLRSSKIAALAISVNAFAMILLALIGYFNSNDPIAVILGTTSGVFDLTVHCIAMSQMTNLWYPDWLIKYQQTKKKIPRNQVNHPDVSAITTSKAP